MAKIIRYCVLEEEHCGENVFLCHRPYVFGNPFIFDKNSKFKNLVKTSSLEECLHFYDLYFDKSVNENPEFKKEFEKLIDAYFKYDEVYLGCYCKLDKPCHTDIIANKVQQYLTKKAIEDIIKKRKKSI